MLNLVTYIEDDIPDIFFTENSNTNHTDLLETD